MSDAQKPPVEQIRYHGWGTNKPEHAWYWGAVDSLAWLIGRALEAEGIRVDDVVKRLLAAAPAPVKRA